MKVIVCSPSRVVGGVLLAIGLAAPHARAEDAVMPDPPRPPPALAEAAPAAASPAEPAPAPASAPAPAAPPPPAEESIHPLPAVETPSRWYGWQTLAADGAGLVLIVASISLSGSGGDSASEALGWGALGTYALGAPVLHVAHLNPGRGFASLGLRIVAPISLGVLGAAAEGCNGGDFCGIAGAFIGATTGVIAAVVIDAAVFAYDDRPEGSAVAPRFQLGLSPRGVVATGTF